MAKVFIRTEQAVDGLAKINFVHYIPDMLTDEEKQAGVIVDNFVDAPSQKGKVPIYYYDEKNKEVIYKYDDLSTAPSDQQNLLDTLIVDSLNSHALIDSLIVSNLS